MNSVKGLKYAGFFNRLMAFIVEHVVLIFVPGALIFTYSPELYTKMWELYRELPFWILPFIYQSYLLLFNFYFLVKYESSIGKMLFNLKVRSLDNKKLSILQIIDREIISKQFSSYIFYLGYFISAFRRDSRTLHDLLAKSQVINESPSKAKEATTVSPPLPAVIIHVAVLCLCTKIYNDFINQKNQYKHKTSAITDFNSTFPVNEDELREKQKEHAISRIKSVSDLSHFTSKILNDEDVQLTMINENPLLIRFLPVDVSLTNTAIEEAAKSIYKFNYFLPDHLKGNPEVLEALEKNKDLYELHKTQFMNDSVEKRGANSVPSRLIHPDFFEDPAFAELSLRSGFFYDKKFSKHSYLSFLEFSDLGLENLKASAIKLAITPKALPEPLRKDVVFLRALAKVSHDVDAILTFTDDPEIWEIKTSQVIQSMHHDLSIPSQVHQNLKIQNQRIFQNKIYQSFPQSIKYLDDKIEFDQSLLKEFISTHFKPERFFSAYQRSLPEINSLLKQYPNDSEKFLTEYENVLFEKVTLFDNLGTSSAHWISSMPDEIKKKDSFHIKVFSNPGYDLRNYIKSVFNNEPFSKGLKEWIIQECEKSGRFYNHTVIRQPDDFFIRGDEDLANKLKDAWQKYKNSRRKLTKEDIKIMKLEDRVQQSVQINQIEDRKRQILEENLRRQREIELEHRSP